MATLGGSFSTGFAQGLSRQLESQIGPDGQGPLARSFSALAQQMSAAAADGFAQSLREDDADCTEPGKRQCAQQRVQALSRSVGAGVAQGFASALRVPVLIVAFLAGVMVTILALAFVRMARRSA
jgi:hypothetical protein